MELVYCIFLGIPKFDTRIACPPFPKYSSHHTVFSHARTCYPSRMAHSCKANQRSAFLPRSCKSSRLHRHGELYFGPNGFCTQCSISLGIWCSCRPSYGACSILLPMGIFPHGSTKSTRNGSGKHFASSVIFTYKGQHRAFAPQPNCKFNVDANSGHAFGILLAAVGALRPCGAPAPVN
jgi:hypothetical protein